MPNGLLSGVFSDIMDCGAGQLWLKKVPSPTFCWRVADATTKSWGRSLAPVNSPLARRRRANAPHDRTGKRPRLTQMHSSMMTAKKLKMASFYRSAVHAVVSCLNHSTNDLVIIENNSWLYLYSLFFNGNFLSNNSTSSILISYESLSLNFHL